MPRWFSPPFHERDPETVHAFRAMVQNCPANGYLGCCGAMRDADLRDRVAGIGAPTLLVASTADTATPPEGLHFIQERIPGSTLVTLNTGPMSNGECADEFTAAVLDILKAKGQRPKTKDQVQSTKLNSHAETNDGTSMLYFLILL